MSQPPIAWPLSFPLNSVFIQIEGLHSYNWPLLILIYKITHYIQHIVLGNSLQCFAQGPVGWKGPLDATWSSLQLEGGLVTAGGSGLCPVALLNLSKDGDYEPQGSQLLPCYWLDLIVLIIPVLA